MEETISLKELMQVLRKRLSMIALITLGAMIVTAIVTYFVMTPVYESSTQILVNKASDDQTMYTTNAVQTNVQLVNTYNVIIKSPSILDKVIDELKLNMTTDELNSKIEVSTEQNSQVFTLTVKDTNPYMATKIANKIGEVFKKRSQKHYESRQCDCHFKSTSARGTCQPETAFKYCNCACGRPDGGCRDCLSA